MDADKCPEPEALEEFAGSETIDATTARHVESCAECRATLERIRENNRFLCEMVEALEGTPAEVAAPTVPLPDGIPGYTLEREIHRGGHGVIYLATQVRTKRRVAMKMLLRGTLATPRQRQRFEREAEIVASLRHPGIVTVYDGGYLEDGRYGFAMEYIEGVTLDQWAQSRPIRGGEQVRGRLRLFAEVCDAVGFAHRHGVIHRDLKPANILIDEQDHPHVLDFGIAKALESEASVIDVPGGGAVAEVSPGQHFGASLVTLPGEFAGTPAYASPEQVSGDPSAIDTRTDVYSLGVILYQLLTGQLPYPATGDLSDVVWHIERTLPRPPSSLTPHADRDIDAIVLRALVKEKDRRYGSVAGLQQDVMRYLAGDAVEARSDSAWYVLRKSVRRHRTAASVVGAVVATLAVFAGAMTYLYGRTLTAEIEALRLLRVRDIEHGRTEARSGDPGLALDLLWRAHLEPVSAPPPRTIRFGGAIEPLDSYWALWEFYVRHPCVRAVETQVRDASGSPVLSLDGALIACAEADGARVWTVPEMRLVCALPSDEQVLSVTFASDCRSVVTVTRGGRIGVWSLPQGELIRSFDAVTAGFWSVRVSAEASAAAFLDGRNPLRVVYWAESSGGTLPVVRQFDYGDGEVRAARFSRDGSLLATVAIDSSDYYSPRSIVSVCTVPDNVLIASTEHGKMINAIEFAQDGRALVLSSGRFEVARWEFGASAEVESLAPIASEIVAMWYRGDDALVVTADAGRMVCLWDLPNQRQIAAFGGHTERIASMSVLPGDPIRIVTAGSLSVREWEHPSLPWTTLRSGDLRGNHAVAFSPDGQSLAISGGVGDGFGVVVRAIDGEARGWEAVGHERVVTSVAYNADGQHLASGGADGVVCLWRADDGALVRRFTEHSTKVAWVCFDPVADRLASAADDGIVVRRLDGGSPLFLSGHTDRVPCVEFSPDGRTLASASMDGSVRLWDAGSGASRAALVPHGGQGSRIVRFSPDGEWLASGGNDRNVVLTNLRTGERHVLRGHPDQVFALAFDPEGRVLLSGDRAGNLLLWDVDGRRQIAALPPHRELLMCIAVSPDGATIATSSAGYSPEVRLWDFGVHRRHIAGSLEYEAARVARSLGREPSNLGAMRLWAAEIGADR